jgi:acyl-CoA thioesterase
MHAFDQDTALTPLDKERFATRISADWSINRIPNGGYLMALLARAMGQCSDKQVTPIVTANFMARCRPGAAEIRVAPITASAQFSRLQAHLFQDGEEKIRALGTFARSNDSCPIERYESGPPQIAPRERCFEIPEMPGYTLFKLIEVRIDPACAGWMTGGGLAERSEHRGWIRFKQPRPFDSPALLLAADAFPPPVLASQGMVAWVPTIEFSVSIRRSPQDEWLRGLFRTRFVSCGLLEEDGELWDAEDRLVAVSRQIAQFRPATP